MALVVHENAAWLNEGRELQRDIEDFYHECNSLFTGERMNSIFLFFLGSLMILTGLAFSRPAANFPSNALFGCGVCIAINTSEDINLLVKDCLSLMFKFIVLKSREVRHISDGRRLITLES